MIKQEKRMNRLDQEKALKDMERDMEQHRRLLKQKLVIKKEFVV